MTRTTRIQTDYDREITHAVSSWPDHENMSIARVTRWLAQFEDSHLPLAIKILQCIRYFDATNIRGMTNQLHRIVTSGIPKKIRRKIGFVPIGNPGSGSAIVARVLRDLVRETRHEVINIWEIAKKGRRDFTSLVFVDDFSGTGTTFKKWWNNVESLVLPLNTANFYAVLVLNEKADLELSKQGSKVFSVVDLDSGADVLSKSNSQFSEQEKTHLLGHCVRTGCSQEYEKGFGNCGLLIAFTHGCPNNSLPILWYETNGWWPLFKRRSI